MSTWAVKLVAIFVSVCLLALFSYVGHYISESDKITEKITEDRRIEYLAGRKAEFKLVAEGGIKVLEIRQVENQHCYKGSVSRDWSTAAIVQSNGAAGKRFSVVIKSTLPAVAGDTWSLGIDDSGELYLDELLDSQTPN